MKSFTFWVRTMGCKANTYDSALIEKQLEELGGVRRETSPDLFVLNSCTVTQEADRQAARELAALKRKSPETFTILTGCYAQVGRSQIEADPELNSKIGMIVDNGEKTRLRRAVAGHFGIPILEGDPTEEIYWGELPTIAGKTRSFIKIQEGCNDYCTYCIIPYARGKSRSVPLSKVLAEIQRLALLGIQEVVLTGTNIADYGKESGMVLEDLLEAVLEHTSIPRVRLTSLDPTELTDRLLKLVGYRGAQGASLMPHIHVSLQSPVSRVLRAMKREYRREEVVDALRRINELGEHVYVGMDVIAGFPSETPEEHAEALETLSSTPWTRLHVFPYSEREGTPATRIGGVVPWEERKRRAQALMALSDERHARFAKNLLKQRLEGVLFESPQAYEGVLWMRGHAPNYVRVFARLGVVGDPAAEAAASRLHNTIGAVEPKGLLAKPHQDWTVTAELVEELRA